MRRTLKQLNDVVGVKGSMAVTKDGMVIASHLARHLEEDLVAAMAATAIRSTERALERNGLPRFDQFTLVASHGKMVFADTGPAYLVVVMDRNVDVAPVQIEIESAAMRIKQLGEIRV
jgi:predicted regulator of Ras-like GTPase activity (Roadblock/LC7/MglB family)